MEKFHSTWVKSLAKVNHKLEGFVNVKETGTDNHILVFINKVIISYQLIKCVFALSLLSVIIIQSLLSILPVLYSTHFFFLNRVT